MKDIYIRDNFIIKPREIISSIAILTIMLGIGYIISDYIEQSETDKNERYHKALQIDNPDYFKYALETNFGDAFIYGKLTAADKISMDHIYNKLYIEKVHEHYTHHTRSVPIHNSKGHVIGHRQESYYTWDKKESIVKHSKQIIFCGQTFQYSQISGLTDYLSDVVKNGNDRYKYYVIDAGPFTGTIFTEINNHTIAPAILNNCTLDQCVEHYETHMLSIVFWTLWIMFIIAVIFIYYSADNKWLD